MTESQEAEVILNFSNTNETSPLCMDKNHKGICKLMMQTPEMCWICDFCALRVKI